MSLAPVSGQDICRNGSLAGPFAVTDWEQDGPRGPHVRLRQRREDLHHSQRCQEFPIVSSLSCTSGCCVSGRVECLQRGKFLCSSVSLQSDAEEVLGAKHLHWHAALQSPQHRWAVRWCGVYCRPRGLFWHLDTPMEPQLQAVSKCPPALRTTPTCHLADLEHRHSGQLLVVVGLTTRSTFASFPLLFFRIAAINVTLTICWWTSD